MLKFIFENLGKFKLRALLIFLAGIFDSAAVFMGPVIFSKVVDAKPEQAWFLFEIAVICVVISLALQWCIRKFGESLGYQFGNQTRYNLFSKLKYMSVSSLNKTHSGYMFSLINRVSDGVKDMMHDVCWSISKIFSNLTLFFVFIYLESPILAIINFFILTFFVLISVILSRKMAELSKLGSSKRAILMELFTDMMANISTVKKLGLFSFAEDKLTESVRDNYQQIAKIQSFHANRWFVLHSLFWTAFLVTMGYLLYMVQNGRATIAVFVLYLTAYQLIKGNVERLSESYKLFVENRSYLENLQEVMILDDARVRGKVEKWNKIIFEKVTFQHQGTAKKIKIPSFEIGFDQKIALIGKSGQGKSTFINLLINFISEDVGERSLDDLPYDKVPTNFWAEKFALVNQEVELFNLTLRENLLLGRAMEDDKLYDYLKQLDLLDWCLNLEKGLDTIVGEKGLRLSAGQKQRINLLRGILLDREIIILDEPTSNLDIKTEKMVISFLRKYLKGKTALIVTHRPELLKLCQKTYKIEKHQLMEV